MHIERGRFNAFIDGEAHVGVGRALLAVLSSAARAHLAFALGAGDEGAAAGAVGGGGAVVAARIVGHLVAAVGALHPGHRWRVPRYEKIRDIHIAELTR